MVLAIPKNIRLQIRYAITTARFPSKKRKAVETLLVRAVRQFRVMRVRIPVSDGPTHHPVIKRGKGRPNQTLLRNFLIAAVFRAWMVEFNQHPAINRKRDMPTAFVRFAQTILMREGIGKTLDNLEKFQSYRKRLMMSSGFAVARGRVN